MHCTPAAILTVLLATLVNGQLGAVGNQHQQKQFAKDLESAIKSYKDSPEATSLMKEVSSYLTGSPAQVTQEIQAFAAANLPTNAAEFKTWLNDPLFYATQGAQPSFVQAMPSKVQQDYLKAQYSQLHLAASIAQKNFNDISASPYKPANMGLALAAAAGATAAAAILL